MTRKMTKDDYRKDNKALRSVIFITEFTKIEAKLSIDVCRVSLLMLLKAVCSPR